MMESRKKRPESERKSGGMKANPSLVPIFDIPEFKKNKELLRLKMDFEERARARPEQSRSGARDDVLYVDATRNVGVVMGEKDIGADMRKQGDSR